MNKPFLKKIRDWAIVQKYTLQRGYSHLQFPAVGVILATSIKGAFPGIIDNFNKFVLLCVFCFALLYFIGFLDKRWGVWKAENDYITTFNPYMMEVVENTRPKEK
jgi:UDP-N-acetylmuramyl pentapeptide phosphotransferase/UDP-N-acetylglucosamine-1-phosphate transferase